MVWQLLQVRKLHRTPMIMVGKMWEELTTWARTYMLRPGLELANAEDLGIPRCVGTVEEARAIIGENRGEWFREQAARVPAPGGEA